jgi:hypothetical protein
MRSVLLVRVAAVLLALFAASFIAFPSFPSAATFISGLPPTVNRVLKGDRLPLIGRAMQMQELEAPAQPALARKVPLGCEGAFSSISAPRLANVFRRCVV